MSVKRVRVAPIEEACECPFYVANGRGERFCFIKNTVSLDRATGLLDDASVDRVTVKQEEWDADCGGKYNACPILELLYVFDDSQMTGAIDPVAGYDPFSEDDADSDDSEPVEPGDPVTFDSFSHPAAQSRKKDERAEREREEYASSGAVELTTPVKVLVRRVDNPYAVKCDTIAVATSSYFDFADPQLLDRAANGLRVLGEKHKSHTVTGDVIFEAAPKPGVAASKIAFAIIGGVQAVNPQDISRTVRKCLLEAVERQDKVLCFVPFDYAGYDIELTAMEMLSTVRECLLSSDTQHLRHVVFVMSDEESEGVFLEYHRRVFGAA